MGVLERISSFARWPSTSNASPLSLANAGFMYTGERDKVRCPICRLEIALDETSHEEQSARLNPRDEHRIRSPQCQLALECSKPDSEVIAAIRNNFWPSEALSAETAGRTNHPRLAPRTGEATNSSVSQTDQKPSENMRELLKHALDRAARQVPSVEELETTRGQVQRSVIDRTNPDFSELKLESARLGTYHDWPGTAPVEPEALAADGFFYTGRTDRVCCAFCRGILHRWARGDVPSAEHRRHFPDCPFIRGQKVGNVPICRDRSSAGELQLPMAADSSHVLAKAESQSCNTEPPTTRSSSTFSQSEKEALLQQTRDTISKTAENTISNDDTEEQQLLMENQRLTETMTCKVCLDRAVNTVFLPCGHLVACDECSPRLRNCPICRTYIRGTVKTFLS